MRLKTLAKSRNEVAAYCSDGDAPDVLVWLHGLPQDMQGSAKGFKALFDRYAADGTQNLSKALFHQVDTEHQIWEFIKGRLRIFCFMDGGKLLILTHGVVKKSQKVDPSAVASAVVLKARYMKEGREND